MSWHDLTNIVKKHHKPAIFHSLNFHSSTLSLNLPYEICSSPQEEKEMQEQICVYFLSNNYRAASIVPEVNCHSEIVINMISKKGAWRAFINIWIRSLAKSWQNIADTKFEHEMLPRCYELTKQLCRTKKLSSTNICCVWARSNYASMFSQAHDTRVNHQLMHCKP